MAYLSVPAMKGYAMRTIETTHIPKCDLCKAKGTGIYDIPLAVGSWANVCQTCYESHPWINKTQAEAMGSKKIPPQNHKAKEPGKAKIDILLDQEDMNMSEFMEKYGLDSMVPSICMNPDCDYTCEMEPDQSTGWCPDCKTNTVKSGLVLLGLI